MPIHIPEISTDSPLNGDVTIKRGDNLDNPRGGSHFPFKFQIDEVFAVLAQKIKWFSDEVTSNSDIIVQGVLKVFFEISNVIWLR